MDRESVTAPERELFSRITSGRTSTLIVERIRELISEGRLSPGDRLPSERELAEQFGVSRVTVRDALRALEAGGLVQIKVGANGGAVLRAPTSDIVGQGLSDMLLMSALTPEEVAEARLVMEANTVALVVERATEADLAELREICDRSARALAAGEYDVHLSWEFHERLARATHNHAIELITRSFRGPLSMAGVRAREDPRIAHARSVREHAELVDALEARDAERARWVLAQHLARATDVRERLRVLGIHPLPERTRRGGEGRPGERGKAVAQR